MTTIDEESEPSRTEPEPYVYRTRTEHEPNFFKVFRTRTEHEPKILGPFPSLILVPRLTSVVLEYWPLNYRTGSAVFF